MARDRDKKIYIGSQLADCKDFNEMVFRRPVEKGYIVNWEAQKEIWEHEFFDTKAALHCDPRDTGLLLTEAPNGLPALQTNCDQVVFEEFQFASYCRTTGMIPLRRGYFMGRYLRKQAGPSLNAYNDVQTCFKAPPRDPALGGQPAEILLVVDSGYSHTTVTPLLKGRPLNSAVRRLDIGGKLMTNYLKELVSLRQYNMIDETHIMNSVKEACCYIPLDFKSSLERTWKGGLGDRRKQDDSIVVDYVLPDYSMKTEGFIRPHDPQLGKLKKLTTGKPAETAEDVLTLRNERFVVPELLFSPSDIGSKQPGLADIIMQSLSVLPIGLWPGLLANIVVVGGNANIEGFIPRLQEEVRCLAPTECVVRVGKPENPITSTWEGGVNLAKNEELLHEMSVTKQEYDEHGAAWVARKFGGR
jgi:actin-related protein 6